MRKKPRHRTARPSPVRRGLARKVEWLLVIVDQEPIRRHTAAECSAELTKLEVARAEWRHFDHEDKPAFQRWIALNFGAQHTLLRDGQIALREKESIIEEVERECASAGGSRRAAYARVMRRRKFPQRPHEVEEAQGPEEEEREDTTADAEAEEEIPRDEQQEMFEEFLRAFMQLDPSELSPSEYARMFAEFQAEVAASAAGSAARPTGVRSLAAAPPLPARTRIKEVYRMLVRRLHPDLHPSSDSAVATIWHEVQEAYGSGNLERLELLLALTDIQAENIGAHTSLFQMREVLADLRRGLKSLEKSLRTARKDQAWGFARSTDRSALQVKTARKFRADLAKQYRRLQGCYALIARWSRKQRSPRRMDPALQVEFSF